jgi:ATP:corrinoid adenosyltransferase
MFKIQLIQWMKKNKKNNEFVLSIAHANYQYSWNKMQIFLQWNNFESICSILKHNNWNDTIVFAKLF